MNTWWILLITLNFALAAGYLIYRGRHAAFPFWLYLAAALLFWWPVTIYPLLFHVERRLGAAQKQDGRVAGQKIRLAWMVWAFTVLMQGLLMAVFRQIIPGGDGDPVGEAVQLCVAAATFMLVVVMLTAVRYLEEPTA